MDGPCVPTSDVAPSEDASQELRRRSENARQAAHVRHDREARIREAVKAVAGGPGSDADPWGSDAQPPVISDARLLALAHGFQPSEPQLGLARAHIQAGPRATLREICDLAGVNLKTARSWLKRHPGMRRWIQTVLLAVAGNDVAKVWGVVKARALAGSERAAHMYLCRFDPLYAALRSGRAPEAGNGGRDGPTREEVAAAKAAFASAQVAKGSAQKERDM